ncbi:MAG TPA: CAP domain-containing protein [Ornithinibacter sp.]|nr:CAP domain-containing protein [Ornithinibacter sp.]
MSHPSPRTSLARAAVCVVLAAPLALATAPSAGATTTTDLAKQVVTLVNAERKKVKCAPLRTSPALTKAAKGHSADMAKYSYFSHTSRNGRSPWQRMRAQGYNYGSAENIAAGQTTARSVVAAWMKSTGHRKNILKCSNKAIGVGVARGGRYGIYWTQDFGTR